MNKKIVDIVTIVSILAIIYLAVWVRLSTINTPTVLDYDPFWFMRHAQEILQNNFIPPKWDTLSYFPPGRPYEKFLGWSYTIAIFFKILQVLSPAITLTKVAILSPLIMVGLAVIPAFFLGKIFSNKIGGLATALFLVLTPTLIGVSMAGYCDSDAPVVFYAVLSIFLTILALKKSQENLIKSIPFIIFAIISNLLFIYNWGGGWITLIFFIVLIPGLFIFRIIEEMVHSKKLKFAIEPIKTETKPIFQSLLIILIATNLIGFSLNLGTVFQSFLGGLAFTGLASKLMLGGIFVLLTLIGYIVGIVFFKSLYGRIACTLIGIILAVWVVSFINVPLEPLLVNISVAELQPLNIFSREGFLAVANRVGLLPTILTLIILPLLAFYKIYRKEKITYAEIFLFLWALVSFYLITRGVRFSLLFSISTAVASGYVIGNLFVYLKKRSIIALALVFGAIGFFSLMFLSNAIQLGLSDQGMTINQNWYNALDWLKTNANKKAIVSTWWDPGHIIAGYTGLRVHADGAHCGPGDCIPYNHNIRIQEMGRAFSTSDENESASIMSKYMQLTPEQCQEVKKTYGDIVPKDACDPTPEMYFIASDDLIGKYYWLSYFGTGQGRNFVNFGLYNYDQSQKVLTYCLIVGSDLRCDIGTLSLAQKNNQIVPVLSVPQQSITNAIVKNIVYYQNGIQIKAGYANVTSSIDGLVWVDSSFRSLTFMDPVIQNSVFTRLFFFNGEGLKHFELVYSNPEVKIFKIKF
jgi:dolichyl-diphosphooligosaccharide--protein glycosyltransferase